MAVGFLNRLVIVREMSQRLRQNRPAREPSPESSSGASLAREAPGRPGT